MKEVKNLSNKDNQNLDDLVKMDEDYFDIGVIDLQN